MGSYNYSKEEFTAYEWCIKNGIRISPMAKDNISWWVEISIGKKTHRSPECFTKDIIWQKVFEFYTYYYNKNLKLKT